MGESENEAAVAVIEETGAPADSVADKAEEKTPEEPQTRRDIALSSLIEMGFGEEPKEDEVEAGEEGEEEGSDTSKKDGEEEKRPPTETRVSESLAKISRAERASRKRLTEVTRRLEHRQKELEAREAKAQAFERYKEGLISGKEDPAVLMETLSELLGVSLDADILTKSILDGKLDVRPRSSSATLPKEVTDRITRLENQIQSQADRDLDEKVAAYHNNVEHTLTSDPDAYEFIAQAALENETTPRDLVLEHVAAVYDRSRNQHGGPVLLTYKDACDQLEGLLFDQYRAFSKTKKAQTVNGHQEGVTPQANVATKAAHSNNQTRTLTNALTAQTKAEHFDDSKEGRRKRAMAALDKVLGS